MVTSAEPPSFTDVRDTGPFGVIVFLASDVMLFAPFFAAYFLLRATNAPWPPDGVELDVPRAALATAVLLASSFTLYASDRAGEREGGRRAMRRWLLVTIGLGAVFLVNQIAEYATLDFGADDHPYGSVYWLLTGLHGAHVTVGLAAMGLLFVRAVRAPTARGGGAVGQRGVAVLAPRRRRSGCSSSSPSGCCSEVAGRACCSPSRRWRRPAVGIASFAAVPGRGSRTTPSARSSTPRSARRATAPTAAGVEQRGPSLLVEGPAAVDFVLRTGRMPMAEPSDAGPPRAGPLHRGGDRRPRRLRRILRRRPGHPGRRRRGRRRRARRRAVPAQLRRLPRGLGRRRGDRRRPRGAVADGVDADEIGQAILVGPGAMPVFGRSPSRTSTTPPPTCVTSRRSRRRRCGTSAEPGRWPKVSPAWLLALLPLVALTRWIGSPHEGRDPPEEVA